MALYGIFQFQFGSEIAGLTTICFYLNVTMKLKKWDIRFCLNIRTFKAV